jgi:hypothetical protein
MCAGATREAAFWDTLHANTTRSSFGQDLDQNMMASASAAKEASKAVTHSNADRAATTPDEGSQSQRPDAKQPGSQSMKLSDASSRSSMNDTYDFLAEVEGGSNQLLPFLDEVGSTVRHRKAPNAASPYTHALSTCPSMCCRSALTLMLAAVRVQPEAPRHVETGAYGRG